MTRTFRMKFEPMTIEHLGLRLYSTLPPVLSELVSNAYDADAALVAIKLPTDGITPSTEVVIRDFGHGMDADGLQNEYLPIGRNRRGPGAHQTTSKGGLRNVTGRKGLGKLSAFGIAEEMELRAISSGHAWTILLNYSEMEAWAKAHPGREYEPRIVKERTGPTNDEDGVEIRLRKLRRSNRIDEAIVRRGLAHRLSFIGPGFKVLINGSEIQPGDRVRREDCVSGLSWDVKDTPAREFVDGHTVAGWIGFVASASQANRGIDIFANGKAAELGSFFGLSTTHAQFARAHVVGEIHANFLDSSDDLISTARNSVVWELPLAHSLQLWGQKLLTWAFDQWVRSRRKEKEEAITKAAGFDTWLSTRTPSEQRVAKKMVGMLVDDDNLDPASARPLLEIVKTSVETVAFHELVDAIGAEKATAATLLKLFDEWRIIEAREHLRLADGRRTAIDQLEKFIDEGALEVRQLQPLLVGNPWLLDPDWTEVDVEQKYTDLLRKECKEPTDLPDGDRRLDIIAVAQGTRHMTVVELKRPEKTLSRRDLEQIERYVDWANANLRGTGPDSPATIDGLLVIGRMTKDKSVGEKVARLRKDGIRVQTLTDLHNASRARYKEVEKQLEKIAPEYTRAARQKRLAGTKKKAPHLLRNRTNKKGKKGKRRGRK